MSQAHADNQSGTNFESQHGQPGKPSALGALVLIIAMFMTIVGAYVEVFLFGGEAQEHWHEPWFKCVIATLPAAIGISVSVLFVRVAKWRRIASIYPGLWTAAIISAALILSYAGGDVLQTHRAVIGYSVASLLTVLIVFPIWYGAYRFVSKQAVAVPAPTTRPATTSPSTAPASRPVTGKLTPEQVARRLGDLRDSIQRVHQLNGNDGVRQDQLRRLQAQVMDLWFPAKEAGILPQVDPPLTRSPDPREVLHDWRRLAERINHPAAPHPLLIGNGTDGRVYVDPPAGIAAWIDHAVALVSVLQEQAAAGPYDSVSTEPPSQPAATPPNDLPRLTVLTDAGSREVTENDPPLVHLIAIQTGAAILRGELDNLERMVERHTRYAPPAGTDHVYIEESKSLGHYHQMRLALLREVREFLPEVTVPILSDFSKAWQWQHPFPDKSGFSAELSNIEHHANLALVKLRKESRRRALAFPDRLAAMRSDFQEASKKYFRCQHAFMTAEARKREDKSRPMPWCTDPVTSRTDMASLFLCHPEYSKSTPAIQEFRRLAEHARHYVGGDDDWLDIVYNVAEQGGEVESSSGLTRLNVDLFTASVHAIDALLAI